MMKKSIFTLILASALVCAFSPSCTKESVKPGGDLTDSTGRDTTEIQEPVDSNYIAPGDTVRQKPVVMWMDASANFDRLKDKKGIKATLDKAVKFGFNGIVIDVKPCEGTVLYDSEFLEPYRLSSEERGFDYLEYTIQEAKKRKMRVEISTTIMTMGNVKTRKGPMFTDPELAEAECVEYTPYGLKKISENPYAFGAINPCHPNTLKYIKRMITEIFTNPKYECVDAYVLDYCRYMNINSDFSDYSRQCFEEYIGEQVPNWPEDIYTYNSDAFSSYWYDFTPGKYYNLWVEWRSQVIRDVISEIRTTLKELRPDVDLEVWAASWGPLPATGQNWASPRYKAIKYNWWATENYHKTGYADLLDTFQLGAYLSRVEGMMDPESIEYALDKCKTMLMGDCNYWGTFQVADKNFDSEAAVYLCLTQSPGCMVFDLVHISGASHWNKLKAGIDRAWETLGVNSPLKSKTLDEQ